MCKKYILFLGLICLLITVSINANNLTDSSQTIVFGCEDNYPPYEMLNADGQPDGFNVDIMKAIAKEMSFNLKIKSGDWPDIKREFESGNTIDVSNMFYSEERDSLFDYSIPLTIVYFEIYTRIDSDPITKFNELSDKEVIVQGQSFIQEELSKNFPNAKLLSTKSELEAIEFLLEGNGDCAVITQVIGKQLEDFDFFNQLRKGTELGYPRDYALVVRKGNSDLLRKLNIGLVRLKDKNIFQEIENKWISSKEEKYLVLKKILYSVIVGLLFLSAIFILVIIWNRTLKSQVEQKTATLQNTHRLLTETLTNMNEGFISLDREMKFTFVNRVALKLFRAKESQFLNKYIGEIFPESEGNELYTKFNQTFLEKKPLEFEDHNKELGRWFFNRLIPTEDGISIFFEEITERKKDESTIKKSESNLKSLIENWTEAVWSVDKEYKFIIFNSFFYEFYLKAFNYKIDVNSNALSVFPENLQSLWKEKYDIALSGKRNVFEFYYEINNDRIYHRVYLNPIFEENKITGVTALSIDITKNKLREKELIQAKEAAEKSDRLKFEFLAQMSHEIRTPVSTMLNYVSLLQNELPDSKNEFMETIFGSIQSSSQRIMRTIDMIINMAEIQTGLYEINKKELNLVTDVLTPIVSEFKSSAENKKLELNFNNNHQQFLFIGDNYSLTQIFANLIDNAIKYTNEGAVSVELQTNNHGAIVNVSDTGVGIGEDFLPYLFEPFRQEEQGYTRSFEGNGLGLALVKRYCEMNNIDIEVESKKNRGTKFTIIFNGS